MSGGDAFVIMAAADIALRERRARSSRSADTEWSPFFGSMYKLPRPAAHAGSAGEDVSRGGRPVARSWVGSLVVLGAALIVLLMVAVGGIAAESVASAAAPETDLSTVEPDALTICREVTGQMICVREPT